MLTIQYTVLAQENGLNTIFAYYLNVKKALSKNDVNAVSEEVNEMIIQMNRLNPDLLTQNVRILYKSNKREMIDLLFSMGSSKKINKQKDLFSAFSIKLWSIIKDPMTLDQNVYYQYCPMRKSFWLSNDTVIENPYYGTKMIHCGIIRDKIINHKNTNIPDTLL